MILSLGQVRRCQQQPCPQPRLNKYVGMCHTTKEILWINCLLKEMGVELTSSPQKVFVDNQEAIFLAKNHVTSEKCKHIDFKYFFLRYLVKDQIIVFEHVSSGENLAY